MRRALAIAAFMALGCSASPTATSSPSSVPSGGSTNTPTVSTPAASSSSPATWGLVWPAPVTTAPNDSIDDMAAWGSAYVAVGEKLGGTGAQAAAWISGDGTSWQQTLLDGANGETGRARQVVSANGGLVAVGWLGVEHCPPGGEGAPPCDPLPIVTWTSPDGRAWIRHDLGDAFAGARFTAVATDATELRAVGISPTGAAAIWSSTDGVSWTLEDLGQEFEQANLADIAWTGSTWLIGGSVGPIQQSGGVVEPPSTKAAIWRADDSGSWQRADFGKAAWNIRELSESSGGIVAAAEAGDSTQADKFWWSADGTDWTPASGIPMPAASDGQRLIGLAFATGDWIAYSISMDGQQWQDLPDSGDLATRPRWGIRPQGDLAFLIGDRLFVTSSDGFLWPALITHP